MVDLKSSAESLFRNLEIAQVRERDSAAAVGKLEATVKDLLKKESVLIMVTELFRSLIDTELSSSAKVLETLQTEGLQSVFSDQDISAKAEISVKRGKVSVDLVTEQVTQDGQVISGDSRSAFGGAVATVQSILMRIIVMRRRGMRPVLILDETLPAFDGKYTVSAGLFLRSLSEKLGLDILAVTHNPALVETAHTAYKIQKRAGKAVFTLERSEYEKRKADTE